MGDDIFKNVPQSSAIKMLPLSRNRSAKAEVIAGAIEKVDYYCSELQSNMEKNKELTECLRNCQKDVDSLCEVNKLLHIEKERAIDLQNELKNYQSKCENLEFELTNKNLHIDQLDGQFKDKNAELEELEKEFWQLAHIVGENALSKKQGLYLKKLKKVYTLKSLPVPGLHSPKKNNNKKSKMIDQAVQSDLSESAMLKPEKTQMCDSSTQTYKIGIHRSTSCEGLLARRHVGTMFPEPPSLAEICQYMKTYGNIRSISPIPSLLLPPQPSPPPTRLPAVEMRSIGTNTLLCDVLRPVDYVVKSSNSRPPSRSFSNIKSEAIPNYSDSNTIVSNQLPYWDVSSSSNNNFLQNLQFLVQLVQNLQLWPSDASTSNGPERQANIEAVLKSMVSTQTQSTNTEDMDPVGSQQMTAVPQELRSTGSDSSTSFAPIKETKTDSTLFRKPLPPSDNGIRGIRGPNFEQHIEKLVTKKVEMILKNMKNDSLVRPIPIAAPSGQSKTVKCKGRRKRALEPISKKTAKNMPDRTSAKTQESVTERKEISGDSATEEEQSAEQVLPKKRRKTSQKSPVKDPKTKSMCEARVEVAPVMVATTDELSVDRAVSNMKCAPSQQRKEDDGEKNLGGKRKRNSSQENGQVTPLMVATTEELSVDRVVSNMKCAPSAAPSQQRKEDDGEKNLGGKRKRNSSQENGQAPTIASRLRRRTCLADSPTKSTSELPKNKICDESAKDPAMEIVSELESSSLENNETEKAAANNPLEASPGISSDMRVSTNGLRVLNFKEISSAEVTQTAEKSSDVELSNDSFDARSDASSPLGLTIDDDDRVSTSDELSNEAEPLIRPVDNYQPLSDVIEICDASDSDGEILPSVPWIETSRTSQPPPQVASVVRESDTISEPDNVEHTTDMGMVEIPLNLKVPRGVGMQKLHVLSLHQYSLDFDEIKPQTSKKDPIRFNNKHKQLKKLFENYLRNAVVGFEREAMELVENMYKLCEDYEPIAITIVDIFRTTRLKNEETIEIAETVAVAAKAAAESATVDLTAADSTAVDLTAADSATVDLTAADSATVDLTAAAEPSAAATATKSPLEKTSYVLRQLLDVDRDFAHSLLTKLEDALFNEKKIQIMQPFAILNLSEIYILTLTLMRQPIVPNPARLFIAKLLFFYPTDKVIQSIDAVMNTYPTVLPHREERSYDNSDPIITVIQHLLMSFQYNMADQQQKDFLSKLRFVYHYKPFQPQRRDAIVQLTEKIKAGKLTNVLYGMALLAKRMHPDKVTSEILEGCLVPLANEYYPMARLSSMADASAATVLQCISTAMKMFPLTTDVTGPLALFGRYLVLEGHPILQEAALQSILRLQDFGFANCFNALRHFQPSFELQPLSKAMLLSFLERKRITFWLNLEKES